MYFNLPCVNFIRCPRAFRRMLTSADLIMGWTYGRAIVVSGSIGNSLDLAHHMARVPNRFFGMRDDLPYFKAGIRDFKAKLGEIRD